MHCSTRTIVAIGCAGLITLSTPAFANPNTRGDDQEVQPLPQARPSNIPRAEPVLPQARPAQIPQARPERRRVIHRPQYAPQAGISRPASVAHASSSPFGSLFGPPPLVAEARKYLGTNPTKRDRLWCATFMNMVLARTGYAGTGSDAAKSFAYYGRRISEPQVGAIAVLTRGKRGGHVGVVTGVDPRGNPIIISGNSGSKQNRRVRESVYSQRRVIAYVMPTDRRETPAPAPSGQQVAQARPGGDGLDSPIAELLAAIANERMGADSAAQVRQVQRTRPASPPVPHRVVQQTALPSPSQGAENDGLPLDPLLAEFFGLNDREDARAAPRSPRRTQRGRTPNGPVASDRDLPWG